MMVRPEVRIVDVEYAPVAIAASLNRRIAPGRPLLRAGLVILWDPPESAAALDRIETSLTAFSPSFQRHECHGPAGYHVFARTRRPRPAGREPLDARLALAHLIEHAVIDYQSRITRERRISGLTGARRDRPDRFDLMVECREPAVGRLCLALAVWTLTGAAAGRPPGPREKDLLSTARLAYRHPRRVWMPSGVARAFNWSHGRAAAALSSLMEFGYLTILPPAMNLSGLPRYAVTRR